MFQLLSDEGIKALLDIIQRESHRAGDPKASRGNKKIIRGLYYSSKFIRDLQNCQELRDHFRRICGEELVPHPSYSNSPQVNISFVGGTKGPEGRGKRGWAYWVLCLVLHRHSIAPGETSYRRNLSSQ